MCKDAIEWLNLRRRPGRANVPQTAWLLGFAEHDVPVLVKAKLLKPLGNPPPNAVKWFATEEVEKLADDESWLGKSTRTLYAYWLKQNRKRTAEPHRAKTALMAA